MTTDKIIGNPENKAFYNASKNRQFGKVDQIIIETQWTDFLQSLVEFGNSNLLQNFQYRLEMEIGKQK
jgi:hypothetical protein